MSTHAALKSCCCYFTITVGGTGCVELVWRWTNSSLLWRTCRLISMNERRIASQSIGMFYCLPQEFEKDEEKKERSTSKSKDRSKDDRKDKERSKRSEDGERRRGQSRDSDEQTRQSRSISPLKQVPWDVFVVCKCIDPDCYSQSQSVVVCSTHSTGQSLPNGPNGPDHHLQTGRHGSPGHGHRIALTRRQRRVNTDSQPWILSSITVLH